MADSPGGQSPPAFKFESVVAQRPTFTWEEVEMAAARFGDFEYVMMLASERDQNFLLRRAGTKRPGVDGEHVVLKVHNPDDDASFVDFQSLCLERAAECGARCQRLLRTPETDSEGVQSRVELRIPAGRGTGVCQCRLLSFVPGNMLGDLVPTMTSAQAREKLWTEVGRSVGRVTAALQGLDHVAAHREFPWDLSKCESVISLRRTCVEEARRPLLDRCSRVWRAFVVPLESQLRKSVVHNDPNDYNLVCEATGVVSVLDFGDLLWTYTCSDAAICMAYLLFHCPQDVPLVESVVPFVKSFHSECPLKAAEAAALFALAVMRACTSVCMSAYQSTLDPNNDYLMISAEPAWAFLQRVDTEAATTRAPPLFRRACGWEAGL